MGIADNSVWLAAYSLVRRSVVTVDSVVMMCLPCLLGEEMVTETSEVFDLLCCRAGVNFDIEACSYLAPKPAVYIM